MKNIFTIILSLALSWPCLSFAQTERNDSKLRLPKEGVIRAFVVFAQIEGDNYGDEHYNSEIWPSGELPVNPEYFIDAELKENSADYESLLSQIYNEISFGKLHIIGDYYPSLIKIPYYNSYFDFDGLFEALSMKGFRTAHGYTYPHDFDNWKRENGIIKEGHDGVAELNILVVRHAEGHYDAGITFSPDPYKYPDSLRIVSTQIAHYSYNSVIRHEVGHAFFPGSNYHSGGHNSGERYFMSELNGFDLMSGGDTFMESYNAWNRNWIGWFPDNYAYEIQAMNQNGVLVNSDLDYTEHRGEVKEFIIRDTPSTGDAVRIKLPYVGQSSEANQYIWLENHQFLESTVNGRYWYNTNFTPKGLYINYQIGNDDVINKNDIYSNGISTLPSFGNYDYFYSDTIVNGTVYKIQKTSEEYNNPLTGKMTTEKIVMDNNNDNSLRKSIYDTECEQFNPYYTFFNGHLIPEEDCVYLNYVYSGGKSQCFYKGDKIGIGYNPTLVPKITIKRSNDTIYLNGLSVEFVDQLSDGSIKVRVRFNDYDVVNNVRWCGNIVSKERVILKQGKTITFDRGFSPTRTENPKMYYGMKLFYDPTVFTADSGSVFVIEKNGKVIITNENSMIFNTGSILLLEDGARLVVDPFAKLNFMKGSIIRLSGNSQIVVESRGVLSFDDVNLYLIDPESIVKCYTYNDKILNTPFIGKGKIVAGSVNCEIQNETINSKKEIYGKKVEVGSNVSVSKEKGDVILDNCASLIINYEESILIDKGFYMKKGSELIIRKN